MSKIVRALRLLVVFGAGLVGVSAQSPYLVGPNVQVSLAQSSVQHYETQIAADPERAGHLIACAYVVRSATVASSMCRLIAVPRGRLL
jgi:hypothetical protein